VLVCECACVWRGKERGVGGREGRRVVKKLRELRESDLIARLTAGEFRAKGDGDEAASNDANVRHVSLMWREYLKHISDVAFRLVRQVNEHRDLTHVATCRGQRTHCLYVCFLIPRCCLLLLLLGRCTIW